MNWKTKLMLQGILLLLMLALPYGVDISCQNNTITQVKMVNYIEQEKDLIWGAGYELDAGLLEPGESIYVNYTVLSHSLSSVRFRFCHVFSVVWTPNPANYTLAPGESYSETYYLNCSAVDNHGLFGYLASVVTENQTATVRWQYKVFNGENAPALGFLPSLSTLIIISIVSTIFMNRKRRFS